MVPSRIRSDYGRLQVHYDLGRLQSEERTLMKMAPVALLSLSAGAIAGYVAFPLLHTQAAQSGHAACGVPGVTRDVVACTLSPEQIDHLSSRIAPAVVERLATSGLPGTAPDATVAAQQREASEKLKGEQSAAFSQAVKIVDQMIASRDITPQGKQKAHELLRQTGQSDRLFEIDARISAAITRVEI